MKELFRFGRLLNFRLWDVLTDYDCRLEALENSDDLLPDENISIGGNYYLGKYDDADGSNLLRSIEINLTDVDIIGSKVQLTYLTEKDGVESEGYIRVNTKIYLDEIFQGYCESDEPRGYCKLSASPLE